LTIDCWIKSKPNGVSAEINGRNTFLLSIWETQAQSSVLFIIQKEFHDSYRNTDNIKDK